MVHFIFFFQPNNSKNEWKSSHAWCILGNGQIISHVFLATLFHAIRIAHSSLKDMDINLEHVWTDLRIFWFECIMDAIFKEGFKTTKR